MEKSVNMSAQHYMYNRGLGGKREGERDRMRERRKERFFLTQI